MKIDPRFVREQGQEVFTGNELLVKGALEVEGGVHLFTGYPGSPIAGFFDALESLTPLLNEHGQVAKLANNEAISLAMVNGAQMAGLRAITAFKSVGLHVASDALALGILAGTQDDSGGLIVCGDDPWCDSTQVPADSRFLGEHCRMPMLEPCNAQEVKDWVSVAFKIGRAGQIFIGYLITVNQADGGGTVTCYPNHYPKVNEHQQKSLSYVKEIEPILEKTVLLPPRTWQRELKFEQRFEALKAEARKLEVNRIVNRPQKGEVAPIGLIAAGNAYTYLTQSLSEMKLATRLPILKMGLVYPVDEQIVVEFAHQCKQVVVIEERRAFVERQVLEILNPLRQSGQLQVEIYGKTFPNGLPGIPSTRGLNPSVLTELLAPLIRSHPNLPNELTQGVLSQELERISQTGDLEIAIPDRTPTFCPGCPHRDSSSVLLELRKDLLDPEYMLRKHKRKPVDMIAHGDTGCYTMLMFEPNKPLMHNYSGMGLGGATGAGVDPFIDNKQIVFMGDGTFFHSGQIAISNSIKANQDITYIILDNKTTAMTGHQTHAGLEFDLMGRPNFAQDIERIVTGMLPPRKISRDVRIVRINPEERERYRNLLEETILANGVKVIIADKECGITFHRRARAEDRKVVKDLGYLPKKAHMNVATEVCEYCLECTNGTGCPGLKKVDTDYGSKIQTDLTTCVNDGACERIHACPAFEEVTVLRKQPPRQADEYVDLENLPDPPEPIHASAGTWRCYLAGVGGMGIGLATAILTTAGHLMGYQVQFLDKKGLAIRNGGVFSQLVYSRVDPDTRIPDPEQVSTPIIPYGKADLIIGIDMLEACRSVDPKHPYRVGSPAHTAAVINTCATPTIKELMGIDGFESRELEAEFRRAVSQEHYFSFNVGDLCERVLDSKLYANIMMLGIAFQRGWIPLSRDTLERAIRIIARHETERNLRAFNIGRKIAVKPELFIVEPTHEIESSRKALRRKINTLRVWYGWRGDRVARQYKMLMIQTFRATRGLRVDDALLRDVIIRAYDCLVWGGMDYAKLYCNRLVEVFKKDHPEYGYQLTRTVVWNLAKVMLIKDEVYVAALLTNPEKYKRDRKKYNVNPANGDRIIYKHHTMPEFDVFGIRVRFVFKSRDWQLRLLSSMKIARSLMPAWHRREKAFRDWYDGLLDQLNYEGQRDYYRWVAVLGTPAPVTGYRDVRYPKMDEAYRHADRLLAMDPELFEPPMLIEPPSVKQRTVSLEVVSGGVGG